jgi:molybdopterin synthase catalytic subunit
VVTFLGVVRDDGIECLEVEAWEEVALEDMKAIREEAGARFDLQEVTIIHRVGKFAVGDPILLIVVSSGHRKQAFRGCEYVLERIKEQAPFWKKEIMAGGDRWVRGNRE